MTQNALASKLLQYSHTTSLMAPGALTAEIGSDALGEALNLGWLRPGDNGLLMLTDEQTQLHRMRELAAKPAQESQPSTAPVPAARAYALGHASRVNEWYGVDSTNSGGAPGSGQPERPQTPAQPQMPTSTPNPPSSDFNIGEDVVVADEGKSYQAKVQSRNQDGTYKLSFGPNRPVQQDRAFRREELQRVTPTQPGEVKVQQ